MIICILNYPCNKVELAALPENFPEDGDLAEDFVFSADGLNHSPCDVYFMPFDGQITVRKEDRASVLKDLQDEGTIPTRCFVVSEDCAVKGETFNKSFVHLSEESARKRLRDLVREATDEDLIRESWEVSDSNENHYCAYPEGDYLENHYCVNIEEVELSLD